MNKGACLVLASILVLSAIVISLQSNGSDPEVFGEVEKVGDMIIPRYNHTATLLEDGRVLVTGGTVDGYSSIKECEVYDPSGYWSSVPPMVQPRMRHDAAVIPGTSNVIVTGGYIGGGHPSLLVHFKGPGNHSLDSSEIFDTRTDTWTDGPDLVTGRFWHQSAVTDNGELIVIGGLNVSLGALRSCEVYRNGIWVEFPPLPIPLARFSLVKLDDGSLLVSGGHNGTSKTGSSRCFRLSGDVWTEIASMNRGRGYFSGALLPDGRYLVTGGFSVQGQPDWSDGEIYDPETDEWMLISSMAFPRHNHATISVGGEVAVIGGSNYLTGGCHSGIEIFNIDDDEWREAYQVVLGRKWAQATVLQDGSVLINGGKSCDESADRTELFIPPAKKSDDAIQVDDAHVIGATSLILIVILLWLVSFHPEIDERTDGKLKHAMPHFSTLALGSIVMFLADPLMLPLYFLIIVFTTLWFWGNICTHCHGWGSRACPSGYGKLSSKLFKKADKPQFRKAFYMNIWSVALQWFLPLGVGVGYLIMDFDPLLLGALIVFVVAGFIILPLTSRHKGCAECPQRKDCPFRGS